MIRHIIIFRPGAIGDTLLTFPALQALRERYEAADITVVGNRRALEIGVAAGIVDRCDAFGADWVANLYGDEMTPVLRERLARYDLGIVWMHAADAAADLATWLQAAGVGQVLPLVSFPPIGSQKHLARFLGETLSGLDVAPPRLPFELPSLGQGGAAGPEGQLFQNADHYSSHNRLKDREQKSRMVILHPGAGARRKRWPAERYAELAERFAARGDAVFLTSGPADEAAVAAVLEHTRGIEIRVLRDYRLIDLAEIIRWADLFIGNDSGMTHLASILGVPTVALFGPFDPAYWSPIGPRVRVVDAGRSCPHRDDPRDGCRQCDIMGSLLVDAVWDAAQAVCQKVVLF